MSGIQDILDAGLASVAAEYEISMAKSEEGTKNQRRAVREVNLQNRNVRMEHLADDEIDTSEQVNDQNEGMYYICQVCAKSFDSKKDVEIHLASEECKGMGKEVKEMYECGECKVLCSSMNSLASHMIVHKQKVIVVRHGHNEHLTRVGYTCTICHKVLGSKGNLAKHQIIHMGIKPYKCSFCHKEFSLKGNRDKHELIHIDLRAHQCQICSKKFTLKGNLQQHILTHSTVKFFRCYLCDKEFTLKGNLDKHIKRHAHGLPMQKVSNKSEPSTRASLSTNTENESIENIKNQVSGTIGSFNIKIGCLVRGEKTKTNNSEIEMEEFDEVAEGEEMNEYVEGVKIENQAAEEEVVETQEEQDAEGKDSGDVVQNL